MPAMSLPAAPVRVTVRVALSSVFSATVTSAIARVAVSASLIVTSAGSVAAFRVAREADRSRPTVKVSISSTRLSSTIVMVSLTVFASFIIVIMRVVKPPPMSAASAASARPAVVTVTGSSRSELTGLSAVTVSVTSLTLPSSAERGATSKVTTGSSSRRVMSAVTGSSETSVARDAGTVGVAVKVRVRSSSLAELSSPAGRSKVRTFAVAPSPAPKVRVCAARIAASDTETATLTESLPGARLLPSDTDAIIFRFAATPSLSSATAPSSSLSESETPIASLIVTTVSAGVPTVARFTSELVSVTLKVSPSSSVVSISIGTVIVPVRTPALTVTLAVSKPFVRSAAWTGVASPAATV